MAGLRKSDAYRYGNFTSDLAGLGKRMWISHSSMNVVITANMNVSSLNIAPGFQNAGQWFDYFSGQPVTITDPVNQSFTFGPGEYKVFTNVQLVKPFDYLNFSVNDSLTGLALEKAAITVEDAGSQMTDSQGKATFTSSPQTVLIKVEKPEYKTYTYSLVVNSDLEKTILLKRVSGAGIVNPDGHAHLQIFPNPARNLITIRADQKYLVTCMDMDGRMLLQQTMQNTTETLDIATLARGVYLMRFKNEGGSFYKKIVVQ
jgi:hypothetical protein